MKILVTGGAGFIGSHLVDSLVKDEHQVLVVDDLSTGKKEYINPHARFVQFDVRDEKLGNIVADFMPDIIYHLAAQKNVRTSLENPMLDASINILGSLNILDQAIKHKVKHFVFVSTCGIYGDTDQLPTTETGPEQALSPYILNKLTFEKYLAILGQEKIKWSAVRLSNIYGPRQDPYGEAGVIAIFLDNAIKGKDLNIFGDGEQTRDFMYVADAVDALLKVNQNVTGIYNIGTGQETSILNLVDTISNIAKEKVSVKHSDPVVGEVRRSCLDYSKASREISWQPNYDLHQGLEITYRWFKEKR
ncbi:NAD-dependent epimerase/dehydratase family protein [Patescibacteria group bacterium]|nr:NAD-dependent epimerase/dehydratase family protein [Patescibacteria group bacterium]